MNKYNPDFVGFNEGVFLKDIKKGLNYHEGFEKLNELEKPLPSALLLLYSDNVDCITDPKYPVFTKKLETLKSSFTNDTMVVKAKYNNAKNLIYFDNVPTTLGEIS